jgi:S-formylglutathione hydrolase FrmB
MGGHGAISLYLRNTDKYRSGSGFAPILNPTKAPWGQKAFRGYLTGGIDEGKAYDSTELIATAKGKNLNILVDYVRRPLPSFFYYYYCHYFISALVRNNELNFHRWIVRVMRINSTKPANFSSRTSVRTLPPLPPKPFDAYT